MFAITNRRFLTTPSTSAETADVPRRADPASRGPRRVRVRERETLIAKLSKDMITLAEPPCVTMSSHRPISPSPVGDHVFPSSRLHIGR